MKKTMKIVPSGLAFTTLIGSGAYTVNAQSIYQPANQPDTVQATSVQTDEEIIKALTPYVEVKDGKIYLNEDYKNSVTISDDVISNITEYMSELNKSVDAGEVVINEDLTVTETNKAFTTASSGTSYKLHWWGVTMTMNNKDATEFAQTLQNTGGATVGAATISRFIPSPPTVLVSTIAGVIGGAGVSLGNRIDSKNKGKGVKIEFKITGPIVYSR
ncbi:hypothetical protein [Terribacillus sp. 7520-G]|uniref:hypothetical protein n=1 Tax=Terribacillus sp. 7520-G TaxID=2025389 RepID=UPI000BA6F448|nr:hypothetical protein [Terribacillus sp. 7520-G]PAD40151.1 hypothetical protein CHH53_03805 [Terribacillus sp. 7520-G]